MGHLPCVQLLSSYGARRRVPVPALDRVVSVEGARSLRLPARRSRRPRALSTAFEGTRSLG